MTKRVPVTPAANEKTTRSVNLKLGQLIYLLHRRQTTTITQACSPLPPPLPLINTVINHVRDSTINYYTQYIVTHV